MNASANTHTLSFQELSAYWAFLQARNREVDAASWEAKRAKKAKLRAAGKEKRARARPQAKAKATVLGCATFAIVWRCGTFGVALRKPKRTWYGCALWRYMCAARFFQATVACAALF